MSPHLITIHPKDPLEQKCNFFHADGFFGPDVAVPSGPTLIWAICLLVEVLRLWQKKPRQYKQNSQP